MRWLWGPENVRDEVASALRGAEEHVPAAFLDPKLTPTDDFSAYGGGKRSAALKAAHTLAVRADKRDLIGEALRSDEEALRVIRGGEHIDYFKGRKIGTTLSAAPGLVSGEAYDRSTSDGRSRTL